MPTRQDVNIKRFGQVIEVKAEKLEEYRALHADSHPGVRHLLKKYNIHNYSIFLHQLDDGKFYLFSYFEYTGTDFGADMEKLKNNPENQAWWKLTDPCQKPIQNRKAEEKWADMELVYHNN